MANIYVRKSGNDSNNGSTPALAKLTIAGAISAMSSGDTVYVGSGVYKDVNINTGAKSVTILGDVTGENTGDAGEVIWSGMNSDDTAFVENVKHAISSNLGTSSFILKNILFQNWKIVSSDSTVNNINAVIKKESLGDFEIENVKITNLHLKNIAYGFGARVAGIVYNNNNIYSTTLKNIEINGASLINYEGNINTDFTFYGIYCNKQYNKWTVTAENIKIKNISLGTMGVQYDQRVRNNNFVGIYFWGRYEGVLNAKNLEVKNVNISGHSSSYFQGINIQHDGLTTINIYNSVISNIHCVSGSGFNTTSTSSNITAHNCSVSNIYSINSFTNYNNFIQDNCLNKATYTIIGKERISKYSPLKGQGSTIFPTTDIDGNPRPAYGNGTACDIGASESTSSIVQKESTVKDSGDFSMKVSPCNYFKREFQIPVTASELRTVKAKIRIDGTWGDYRPRITLSGQGMTASSATKNATTGSFEELTVSGTPTTTGIALLTVEAHSTSTDAIMYLDTITIE